jgi:hypothetical protein
MMHGCHLELPTPSTPHGCGGDGRRLAGLAGKVGLVDGRREPRKPNGTKLVAFNLDGVRLNMAISDATIDVRQSRCGYVVSVHRTAVDAKPKVAPDAGSTNKGVESNGV